MTIAYYVAYGGRADGALLVAAAPATSSARNASSPFKELPA
jgi:hypothetical protein